MHEILDEWLTAMADHKTSNSTDDPCYYVENISELITTSNPLSFRIGTGEQILRDVLPSVARANFEVIIVTCFYAKSSSQAALASTLEELSSRARRERLKIRVRICFSSVSSSLWEKISRLFSRGQGYPPSCWERLFGFSPSKLSDLDLKFSSIFVPPLSVMHPKFIIIDRKLAFLPSCNISWEDWFEGCIEMDGDIVLSLLRFWNKFWSQGEILPMNNSTASTNSSLNSTGPDQPLLEQPTAHLPQQHLHHLARSDFNLEGVQTVFLPSPHHANPKFRLIFPASPPPTPLNIFLLTSISKAKKNIYIQTPNLTSYPALSALYGALKNGIDVNIVTSTRMMLLEQIVTAGTITEVCIANLQRKYRNLLKEYQKNRESELEAGRRNPGQLSIKYYTPKDGNFNASEPVKSHLKLTIVDEEIVVLGSGNMDRASWYTSQELGIAFFSNFLAHIVRDDVDSSLIGRLVPRA